MTSALTIISSMATRRALAELAASFTADTGWDVALTSIGGVEAAKLIRAGEAFDVAVLASEALQRLVEGGFVEGDSVAVFARSPTALGVRAGASRPGTLDEAVLREFISSVRAIGVSSGPSGALVRGLIAAWGSSGTALPRLVEAPPGTPVAHLIAAREVDAGFQQLSELLGEPGIDVIGALPATLVPLSTFAVGRTSTSTEEQAANSFIRHLLSTRSYMVLDRHGLRMP
jgi:molybdate transport system substrate-binding protein